MSININSNFLNQSPTFLDARESVENLSELKNMNNNIIPDGFESYVRSENCKYKFLSSNTESELSGKWRKIESGEISNNKKIVCAIAVDSIDITSINYQYLLTDYTIHKVTEGIDVDVTDEVYVNIIRIEEVQYDALPDDEKNKDYTWYVI